MELQTESAAKRYRNGFLALKGFSLTLNPGILGLSGPNGAGKTTLMNVLATITRPSGGKFTWNGQDIVSGPNAVRTALRYLPQDFGVYPNLNAAEFLEYMAAVKGWEAATARRRIEELLVLVNLPDARQRR